LIAMNRAKSGSQAVFAVWNSSKAVLRFWDVECLKRLKARSRRVSFHWITGPKSTRSGGKSGRSARSSLVNKPSSSSSAGLTRKGLPAKAEKHW